MAASAVSSELSIFGRLTRAIRPRDRDQLRGHLVTQGEDVVFIANQEYRLITYNPDRWRQILDENGIQNPFQLNALVGKTILIPPIPIPGLNA